MPTAPSVLPSLPVAHAHQGDRVRLVRRAKLLARLGVAWHGIEATVAIGAGIVAGSIALIGFGADSLIELVAGLILLWRFGGVAGSDEREHPAHRLIAVTFWVIA